MNGKGKFRKIQNFYWLVASVKQCDIIILSKKNCFVLDDKNQNRTGGEAN